MKNKNQEEIEKISVKISKIEQAYSNYSYQDKKILDYKLAAYINVREKGIKSKKLELDIKFDNKITEDEKIEFANTIRSYYSNQYQEINKTILMYDLVSIFLILVGMLFLVLHIFSSEYIFLEKMLEIAAWVFVWEFIHITVFKRTLKVIDRKKIKKILDAKIDFK